MIKCMLCVVLSLYSGVWAHYEFIFDIDYEKTNQFTSVPEGETVTLVCRNEWSRRVTWYKHGMQTYAAYVDDADGTCTLENKHYPSITPGPHECTGHNYSITFPSVQKTDQGKWHCSFAKTRQSQYLYINVTSGHTTRTHRPAIHTAVKVTSTLKTSLAVVTSLTTRPSETQEVSTTKPETNLGITDESMKAKDAPIPLIAGAIGGTVCLMVIVTILIILVRKRKSQIGAKGTEYNERVNGQHGDHGDLEDGMGGEYAQISDTAGQAHKGVNKTKKLDSVCRKDTDNDELVMADNPMYMQYSQEDKEEKRLDVATSSYDTVPDVYSVVQKPTKSESTVPDVYSVVQKPTKSETTAPDVYSVVQKPTNSQTLSSEDPGPEVYSVVQKPGKTQDQSSVKEVTDVYSVVQKPPKM